MNAQLTQRQQEILDYIRHVAESQGLAPTVQEIQAEFGFRSPNAVQSHLQALHKKGVLERQGRRARSLRVLENGAFSSNGQEPAHRPHNGVAPAHGRNGAAAAPVAATAPQLEMGVDVFFNAKHTVAEEFDGELHAHSWRLRAVVLVSRINGRGAASLEDVRLVLAEVASEIEGVILNQLEPFDTSEPTLEQMAKWLTSHVKGRLEPLPAHLTGITLWDQPTQYVTISENGVGYAS